jgi:hypothetical protein
MKVARTVLRGERGRKAPDLPDPALFKQMFMYIFNRLGASIYSKVRQNEWL